MLKSLLKVLIVVAGLSLAAGSHAQTAPDVLVKSTVDDMLAVIKTGGDRRALAEIIEKQVLPRFDFTEMTRAAMGRHWRDATPEQRRALENAFRMLLVTTYTQALMQMPAAAPQVEIRPVTVRPADDDVIVKTVVRDGSGRPLAIDYRLARSGDVWKVYDVVVESLSLTTNYRGAFNDEIGRSGIAGLIKVLEAKNRQNSAG